MKKSLALESGDNVIMEDRVSFFREMSSSRDKQRTLKKESSMSGTGLFTGSKVHMRFCPAPENTGIVFKRTDLSGAPTCPAYVDHVIDTPRCTILGKGECTIQSVEHVLAAIAGYGIDNLIIELHGPEVPIGDGSAVPFIQMIEEAGIAYLNAKKKWHRITSPIYWTQGDVHLVALPYDEFRVSYTLNYPNSNLLRSQFTHLCIMKSGSRKKSQNAAPSPCMKRSYR